MQIYKKIIYTILLLILIFYTGIKTKYWLKRKYERYQNTIIMEKLIKSVNLDKLKPCEKARVVIIFTPDDCGICLDEISFINEILNNKNEIKFQGIVPCQYPALAKKFADAKNWKFDIFYTQNEDIIVQLANLKKPIKVLMNRNDKIIYMEVANINWQINNTFKNRINDL